MPFSKTSADGYLMVDHRASPGIPAPLARRLGYHPSQVAEGTLFEAPTLGCPHCGACVVLNPLRKRPRSNCYKCNAYICDGCAAAMHHPDYVHRTIRELQELASAGKLLPAS